MITLIQIVLFFMGSVIIVNSIVFALRRRAFLQKAVQTNGTVIKIESGRMYDKSVGGPGKNSRHNNYTTVRFQTADGRAGDCKVNTRIGIRCAVGEQVIVNYDPQNPCGSPILGDRNSQPGIIPGVIMGAILASIGLIWGIISFSR